MNEKHFYPFEKLEIWHISVEVATKIYTITSSFPGEEKFGIISQLRRAATSVSANIAEGSSRLTSKDKARFFQIAYSSLMEVLNFLIISNRLNFITEEKLSSIRTEIEELSNKINAYHRKLRS